MNVSELYDLAEWFEDIHPTLVEHYRSVLTPLSHNASQPNKQPFESQLEALLNYLRNLPFEGLSLQQLQILSELEVDQYIGVQGATAVELTIRVANYDPATAASRLKSALKTVNEANSKLVAFRDSVDNLNVDIWQFEPDEEFITVRIGFRDKAAIENVADLKRRSQDWYEIIRGLALAAGEPPETTKVVGAGTGSIILYLVATVTVTTLLAVISKNLKSVARDILEVRGEVENLRQKKLLTRTIENELNQQESSITEKAIERVVSEVTKISDTMNGEVKNALTKSIKKLLTFSEQGGIVDFVKPADDDESEPSPDLLAARTAIHDYQAIREEIKLLIDASNDD